MLLMLGVSSPVEAALLDVRFTDRSLLVINNR